MFVIVGCHGELADVAVESRGAASSAGIHQQIHQFEEDFDVVFWVCCLERLHCFRVFVWSLYERDRLVRISRVSGFLGFVEN